MPRADRQKKLHAEIYQLIIEAKDAPCARCKGRFPSVCMDFDHLPGFEKKFTIGSPANWTSVGRIKAEIAKTQVVCSNCHRIITWERKNGLTLLPDGATLAVRDAGEDVSTAERE